MQREEKMRMRRRPVGWGVSAGESCFVGFVDFSIVWSESEVSKAIISLLFPTCTGILGILGVRGFGEKRNYFTKQEIDLPSRRFGSL